MTASQDRGWDYSLPPRPQCQAMRGPQLRAQCEREAAQLPHLIHHRTGQAQIWLCLWCAIQDPRRWEFPDGLMEPDGGVELYLYCAWGTWVDEDLLEPRAARAARRLAAAPAVGHDGSGAARGRPTKATPKPTPSVVVAALEGLL